MITARATKKKKAYEQVADSIREQVFAGQLAEGERLPPERDLAEDYGVSRVVVREAIRSLELAGILRVQKGAGGGTFVCTAYDKPLSTSMHNLLDGGAITLENLFEMRLMLEAPAAAKAARARDAEGLGRLDEILERARASREEPEMLRELNLEFHRRLVAMAKNPLLSFLCNAVLAILTESIKGTPGRETSLAVLKNHERIVEVIRAGDAQEARRLTKADLEQLRTRYKKMGVEVSGGRLNKIPA